MRSKASFGLARVTEAAIRTFVKRVRDKVGNNFIKNVPGLGYKIDRRLS